MKFSPFNYSRKKYYFQFQICFFFSLGSKNANMNNPFEKFPGTYGLISELICSVTESNELFLEIAARDLLNNLTNIEICGN